MDPAGKIRTNEFKEPYPVKKQKTEEGSSSVSKTTNALMFSQNAIEASKNKRTNELKKLTKDEVESLAKLEKYVDAIKEPTLEKFCYSRQIEADAKKSDEIEKQITEIEEEIEEKGSFKSLKDRKEALEEQLNETMKDQASFNDGELVACKDNIFSTNLGISGSLVGEFESLGSGKSELMEIVYEEIQKNNYENFNLVFAYQKEKILNRAINTLLYKKEVTENINQHKQSIIQKYLPQALVDKDFDINMVTFDLNLEPTETHHGGKIATKITFKQGEKTLGSVYYKPRNAEIDIEVIEFFKNLNKVEDSKKSIQAELPEYKIENFNGINGIFSIWEFVKGTHLDIGEEGLDKAKEFAVNKGVFDLKGRRLEQGGKAIDLSDLHRENLLFSDLDTQDPKIIPIDLESIQPGNNTGLYKNPGNKNIPPLNGYEIPHMTRFKAKISQLTFRLVILATHVLTDAMKDFEGAQKIARGLEEKLKEMEFNLIVDFDELVKLIQGDFIENDVPYFEKIGDVVKYKGVEIGKKAEKND